MGSKIPYLGIFTGLEILKHYCHIWNQHPQICLIGKFCQKTKMHKFGTKNVFFGYFWVNFLKKLLSYLKSAPSNFLILITKFRKKKKQKCLNLGPKFGFFWTRIWKKYCHIGNQHPQICLIAKFRKKIQKRLSLGQKMPYLGTFGLEFQKANVTS